MVDPALIARLTELFLAYRDNAAENTPVVWLSGAQGSGKSTISAILARELPFHIEVLSLDDFYLPRQHRLKLAKTVSPLFETRGPPGTHEISRLGDALDALQNGLPKTGLVVPKFDKTIDDRIDGERVITEQPDLVLVEGWMLGVEPDHRSLGDNPLNAVEQNDFDLAWRTYQEDLLQQKYKPLWEDDDFIYLLAPDFSHVLDWRSQQEIENYAAEKIEIPSQQFERITERNSEFIQYYERLTRRILTGGRENGHALTIDGKRNLIE